MTNKPKIAIVVPSELQGKVAGLVEKLDTRGNIVVISNDEEDSLALAVHEILELKALPDPDLFIEIEKDKRPYYRRFEKRRY